MRVNYKKVIQSILSLDTTRVYSDVEMFALVKKVVPTAKEETVRRILYMSSEGVKQNKSVDRQYFRDRTRFGHKYNGATLDRFV